MLPRMRPDEERGVRIRAGVADVVEVDVLDADVLDVGGGEPALRERVCRVCGHGDAERHVSDALEIRWGKIMPVFGHAKVEDEGLARLAVPQEEGEGREVRTLAWLRSVDYVVEGDIDEARLKRGEQTVCLIWLVSREVEHGGEW